MAIRAVSDSTRWHEGLPFGAVPGGAERECLVAGGSDPGELAEIADQMGLVGVSGVGCDLSPVQRAALVDVPPHPVEADQPGCGLGPQPGLAPELNVSRSCSASRRSAPPSTSARSVS